jgi:hypothetical protein
MLRDTLKRIQARIETKVCRTLYADHPAFDLVISHHSGFSRSDDQHHDPRRAGPGEGKPTLPAIGLQRPKRVPAKNDVCLPSQPKSILTTSTVQSDTILNALTFPTGAVTSLDDVFSERANGTNDKVPDSGISGERSNERVASIFQRGDALRLKIDPGWGTVARCPYDHRSISRISGRRRTLLDLASGTQRKESLLRCCSEPTELSRARRPD